MADSVGEAEFDSWIPLPAAYRRVGKVLGWDGAKIEIRRRLTLGALRAAARSAYIDDRQEGFRLVGPGLWRAAIPPDHSTVWHSGSYEFETGRAHEFASWQLQGVRVEPSGVEQMLVDAGEPVSASMPTTTQAPANKARRQDLPLLPDSIAQAWADWFKATAPKQTREAADASAAGMFPNHNFSRERVRDLIDPAKQGQRPKNK